MASGCADCVELDLALGDLLNQVAEIGFTASKMQLCCQGARPLAYQDQPTTVAKRSCLESTAPSSKRTSAMRLAMREGAASQAVAARTTCRCNRVLDGPEWSDRQHTASFGLPARPVFTFGRITCLSVVDVGRQPKSPSLQAAERNFLGHGCLRSRRSRHGGKGLGARNWRGCNPPLDRLLLEGRGLTEEFECPFSRMPG